MVISSLSVMAVITNAFLVAFASTWLYESILAGINYFGITAR